jgi:hypothetical protein
MCLSTVDRGVRWEQPTKNHLKYATTDPRASVFGRSIPKRYQTFQKSGPEYSSVQYTRIEDAISAIKMCQSDAYLAKCDIEMAYRNLPLSPTEYYKFGFNWDNQLEVPNLSKIWQTDAQPIAKHLS